MLKPCFDKLQGEVDTLITKIAGNKPKDPWKNNHNHGCVWGNDRSVAENGYN